MIGKVKTKNDELVLVNKNTETPLSPNNPIRFLNTIKNNVNLYGYTWVEYSVETLGTGTNEFDVIDCDFALIEKVYDFSFGTPKESISSATERYNKNKYPVGGFLPGLDNCKCITCDKDFIGDKRSVQCEVCALESQTNQ